MEVIIQPNQEAASAVAASVVARLLREKPNAVLGLPTGNTPLLLFRQLVTLNLDWSKVTTFNLDEYVGLPPEHPASYHNFMRQELFAHINLPANQAHVPDGMAEDIPSVCRRYESQIRACGGIDLQILGIGADGHIGFNEPTSSLASRTRIKTLTPETRRANARFFGSEAKVPQHVITMGIGTLLETRQVLLLAFGQDKARAIAEAVERPVTSMNPASALQMHPAARILLDETAASELRKTRYYRWIYDNKPDWQKV